MSKTPIPSKVIKPVDGKPKSAKGPELLYYGRHICYALAKARREEIIRVYCNEEMVDDIRPLLQWCSSERKAYHVISNEDLEKVTGSVHHEGLAILARARVFGTLQDLDEKLKVRNSYVPLVYLDGVENPHNIGTIMRVMANFGWPYLLGGPRLPALSSAAARISEGGAEFVEGFRASTYREFGAWAKRHAYTLCGTSSHASQSLYDLDLKKRSILVLGHEVLGMGAEMEKLLHQTAAIPCTGAVESLNVAAASGILLSDYTRRFGLCSPSFQA